MKSASNQINTKPDQTSQSEIKKLKLSELRYRRLFEAAQDGIFILDGNSGKITDANPFLINLLGYSHEEFLGKQLWEIGLFKDIKSAKIAFTELEQKKYIRYDDLPLETKNGNPKAVEFVSNVYEVDHKRVIQCNIRDITDHKIAKSKVKFQSDLLNQVGEAIIITDQNGKIEYLNKSAEKIYDLNAVNVVGHKIADVNPNHLTQAQVLEMMEYLNRGDRWSGNFVVQKKDGDTLYLLVSNSPIQNEEENTIGIISISSDISDLRQAHEETASMAKFSSENPNPILRLNYDGTILYANKASEKILEEWKVNTGNLAPKFWRDVVNESLKNLISENIEKQYFGRDFSFFIVPVKDLNYVNLYVRDITERKKIDEALQSSEAKFRSYIEHAPLSVFVADQFGRYVEVNRAAAEMMGYTEAELLKLSIPDVLAPQSLEVGLQLFTKVVQDGSGSADILFRHKDDTPFWASLLGVRLSEDRFMSFCQDITDRKLSDERLKKLSSIVEQTADVVYITDRTGIFEYVNPAFCALTGFSKDEVLGKTPRILNSGLHNHKDYEKLWGTILNGRVFRGELINRKKNGGLYYEEKIITPLRDENNHISHFVSTGKDVTDQLQRERELEGIVAVSTALRVAKTLDELLPILLDVTLEVMHLTQGAIWLYDSKEDELRTAVTRGWREEMNDHRIPPEKPGEGINGRVFKENKPYVSRELCTDKNLPKKIRQSIPPGVGGTIIPISSGNDMIGTFNINVDLPRELRLGEIRLIAALSDLAGNAIQRMRLFEKTEKDAQRFAALHAIDVSINTSDTLKTTLNFLLGKVVELLNVSAADILLFNPFTLTLNYSAGRGFRSHAIDKSHLNLGEGFAGRAILERRTLNAPDLRIVGSEYGRKDLLAEEEFVAYYGVPLIVKDKVIGVLEIFNRSSLKPDADWLDFMETLASQAATAIDSATLFSNLEKSNIELLQAYDKTIEGWSHAMDLRDQETEGHTQRVTELTVRLAKSFGMGDEEIAHVRRGALLHDMGKMGIPDSILLKPGPLTDEEWVIMRMHPRYAYDMLSPIEFLRSSLDIPYCHHEKWDGTGYPRGLKGKQIPISARIFAIIDVWDALRSDRPYRKAWSEEKTLEYIKSLKNTQFEPKIVDLFFNMIKQNT